ncbi:MAG: glycosyl transferase family 1 [Isosphaera sp.]|nr:glycosyl transferase family 1 [Isosphaera sp.]
MTAFADVRKLALVGNYLPRKCGIATFTHDMHASLAAALPAAECAVVAVTDAAGGYDYPPEVRFEVRERHPEDYRRAAEFLNLANTDVVCLQHEYGIFGGTAGSHVLGLLRHLRAPVVTTLHTVLKDPDADQRRVMGQVCELSARVAVMTDRGRRFLTEVYGVPAGKIDLIAHGIPDMPFVDPNFYKDQFGVEGKRVLLTFGLLSPNKGVENVIRALPAVTAEFPDAVYVVLGATHPNLVREHGETYRRGLEKLAADLGVGEHVRFFDRFVTLPELTEFLGAADVYVTPYLNPAQVVSGTLAYAFGCGKAVVSTPYWHAEELLADGRGVLVPFGDAGAVAREVTALLRDDNRRHAMRKKAYRLGREMIWARSAARYLESFARARSGVEPARRAGEKEWAGGFPPPFRVSPTHHLPALRLDHLRRMTDGTGLLQHARHAVPHYAEGYCTDDNARGLLLTVLLEELDREEPAAGLATTYAAFLQAAFDPARGRFRNFMGYDRRWLEEVGSEDSHGRAVWALGACVGRSRRPDFSAWAAVLFEDALGPVLATTSPRAWAFALLGVDDYLRRFPGDRRAAGVRRELTARLLDRHAKTAGPGWEWFEDVLTYDNARLPQALIAAGHGAGNRKAVEVGASALRWLVGVQTAPAGHHRPVGTEGWYRRGGAAARFDQQPVDAGATVSACLAAHRATGDPFWRPAARAAFDWFLGRNDLGLEVYDPATGGCRDGLLPDRVNRNQGAESTLAFLLARAELELADGPRRPGAAADAALPAALAAR